MSDQAQSAPEPARPDHKVTCDRAHDRVVTFRIAEDTTPQTLDRLTNEGLASGLVGLRSCQEVSVVRSILMGPGRATASAVWCTPVAV